MKVLLNSFNPNFKAIHLDKNEKKQLNTAIDALQHGDLSEFKKNILKSDIMDVFIPHIKEEAAESDDPKSTSIDLNMKMFDALNSFADKKDPVGWFLSVLNGTKYEDPEPTIFDISEEEAAAILEQIAERKRQQDRQTPTFNFVQEGTCRPSKTSNSYFNFEMESLATYSPYEIHNRAVELRKYFGQQYKFEDILNIVETNKCLVSYDNKYFDEYVTAFAEAMGFDKNIIKISIASHPVIVKRDITDIQDRANDIAQLTGCREEICKYNLLKNPQFIDVNPYTIKNKVDALRFYKTVRNKREITNPKDIFASPSPNISFNKTLIFLVACHDKKNLNVNDVNGKELAKYLNSQSEDKTYKLILPDNPLTDKFIDYADDFEAEHLDRDMFEFEIIDAKEYSHIKLPKSFNNLEK